MDIANYKNLLLKKKIELVEIDQASAGSRKAVELDQTSVGRLSRMDAMQGQAMNNAIAERRKLGLLKIESALKRIEDDEYGFCLRCGEEIAKKRLDYDPATLHCLDCASQ